MTPLIHSQALSRSPDHSKILHLYATFLHKSTKRQHQTSARLWQRAVLLAPRDADILTGYGTLLHRVMCKPEVFTRALVVVLVQLLFSCCSVVVQLLLFFFFNRKPRAHHPHCSCSFLFPLQDAKPLIMRALAVNPQHPYALLANALLLQSNRDYDEAERNFTEARTILPKELSIVTHYSNFLKKCSANYKKSEALFQYGMTLNPCDPDHLGAYAQFMFKVRGNTERADYLFAKAIEADPTHWHNLSRHANMLKKTGTE